jgi:hypothetical protein
MQFGLLLRHSRITVLRWMIIEAVPVLNTFRRRSGWHYSVDSLRQFPPGSWEANLAQFLDQRGYEDFLSNYEAHDAFHTLLDYETDVVGELRLQAFMVGNGSVSFAGRVLFGLGCVLLPELWSQLRVDYTRGRKSPHIRTWNVGSMLGENLADLKLRFATRLDLDARLV